MNSGIIEKLLNIKHPILLGGMAGISDPVLASAVSEAGGLGTLAGAKETGASLAGQIQRTRELTDKPFAVNIPLFAKTAKQLVETVINEKVKVVITAAGDPAIYTKHLKMAGCKVIHVVPTPKLAERAEDEGVDAVIAEGFESGGAASPYEIGTLVLIPRVVDMVKIPVIAAGGITDARGYLAALVLGAAGVSLGTAFLFSRECHKIGDSYREQLIMADTPDTAIVARGIMGVRILKNGLYHDIEKMVAEGAGRDKIISRLFSIDLMAAGDGFFSCGQGVGLRRNINTVKEIIDEMTGGAERLLRQYSGF